MAWANGTARQAYRYNKSAPTLHLTTGLCNWPYTAFVIWCVCAHVGVRGCVCVCIYEHLGNGKNSKQTSRERERREGKEGKKTEGRENCCLGKYRSNKLMSRPAWSHNFSIQREVKLGSSSIDFFFPGFVAVFLSTNSKRRPPPALDVISL